MGQWEEQGSTEIAAESMHVGVGKKWSMPNKSATTGWSVSVSPPSGW